MISQSFDYVLNQSFFESERSADLIAAKIAKTILQICSKQLCDNTNIMIIFNSMKRNLAQDNNDSAAETSKKQHYERCGK